MKKSSNTKKQEGREKMEKIENNQMANVIPVLSKVTLNLNGLHASIKKQRDTKKVLQDESL